MAETVPSAASSPGKKRTARKATSPQVRTVLFAEIAGSGALYQKLGDVRTLGTLTRCLVLLEEQVFLNRGEVVKTVGEQVLSVFADCNAALAAAIAMQQGIEHFAVEGGVALGLRLGLHCGPLIVEQGDVFGDGVNVAARLMKLADPGQILADGASLAGMRARYRGRMRRIDRRRVKGRTREIEIVELAWRRAEGEASTTEQATPLERRGDARIVLRCEERELAFDSARGSVTIGRDASNDLPLASRKASRQHARIEWRRDKFMLFDHSTNGTYVRLAGAQPVLVKHESFLLHGHGLLGIGEAPSAGGRGTIAFACS